MRASQVFTPLPCYGYQISVFVQAGDARFRHQWHVSQGFRGEVGQRTGASRPVLLRSRWPNRTGPFERTVVAHVKVITEHKSFT